MKSTNDSNAILKDLSIVAETTIKEVRPKLVPKICTIRPADGAYEKIAFPTAVPKPVIWGDQRQAKALDVNAVVQYDMNEYELTLDFKRTLLEDSKVYDLSSLVKEATMSAALYPDELASLMIANGVNSGNNAYDGNTFYGDTHNFGAAGSNNIDNKLAGSGTSVTQLQADFEAAWSAMQVFKDNAGRLITPGAAQGAENLIVHCPKALEIAFRRIMNSSMIPVTTNAPGDNILKGIADVYGDGYLTDANDWYIHYVGAEGKPLVFFDRSPLEVETSKPGDSFWLNGIVRIALRQRFKLGYYRFERSVLTTN